MRAARFRPIERADQQRCQTEGISLEDRTAISKSTIFSEKVDMSLLKQNLYSPLWPAVNTKSPCRSLEPSMMMFSLGPATE